MRLVNDLMVAMAMATALAVSSEAIVTGVKAGLDPHTMIDAISAGSIRNSTTPDKFPQAMLPRTIDSGFAIDLSCKDVRLSVEEAEAVGVPKVVGCAVRQFLALIDATFGSKTDFTNIVRTIERRPGIEVRG